ncbi:MAG: hypothetical protein V2A79_12800, partial [Planctomycetota bacterium]
HNDWRSSIPYTVIDPAPGPSDADTYARAQGFAHQTGLLLIEKSPKAPEAVPLQKSLSGSLLQHHVPALTLELGEAYVVNEPNVHFGVRAVWNILAGLEMVALAEEPFQYPRRHCSRAFGLVRRFSWRAGGGLRPSLTRETPNDASLAWLEGYGPDPGVERFPKFNPIRP